MELVVGSGFKDTFLPGYPADPNGVILESDYAYVCLFLLHAEVAPLSQQLDSNSLVLS